MPLRYLPPEQQFRTWDQISLRVRPPRTDRRVESRKPETQSLVRIGHVRTAQARYDWIGDGVFDSLQEMAEAGRSIGPVRVDEITEVTFTPCEADWKPKQVAAMTTRGLFEQELNQQPLEKIPFEFRFQWKDSGGARHESLVISWEMAQTWRNFRDRYTDANKTVRDKILNDTFGSGTQPMLFMGNHSRWRSTFMVCGWFAPKASEVVDGSLF